MSTPFGGSIPEEIVLDLADAERLLFALDEAVAQADEAEVRARLEAAIRVIVEKLLPDLPDL